MKTITMRIILLFACLSISVGSLIASDNTASQEGPSSLDPETRMLQKLLRMDAAELVNMRKTIQRIEQMSPDEKQLLRKKIKTLQEMDPEYIEKMRNKFKSIPEEKRLEMRTKWKNMTPLERKEWRKKLSQMNKDERTATFKKEGFIPFRVEKPEIGNDESIAPQTDKKDSASQ